MLFHGKNKNSIKAPVREDNFLTNILYFYHIKWK